MVLDGFCLYHNQTILELKQKLKRNRFLELKDHNQTILELKQASHLSALMRFSYHNQTILELCLYILLLSHCSLSLHSIKRNNHASSQTMEKSK